MAAPWHGSVGQIFVKITCARCSTSELRSGICGPVRSRVTIARLKDHQLVYFDSSSTIEILDGRIDGSEAKKRSRCMINFKFPVDVSDYPD